MGTTTRRACKECGCRLQYANHDCKSCALLTVASRSREHARILRKLAQQIDGNTAGGYLDAIEAGITALRNDARNWVHIAERWREREGERIDGD
jgi:hypothetical protein